MAKAHRCVQRVFRRVMHELKTGRLKSHGRVIPKRRKDIGKAIAASKARKICGLHSLPKKR